MQRRWKRRKRRRMGMQRLKVTSKKLTNLYQILLLYQHHHHRHQLNHRHCRMQNNLVRNQFQIIICLIIYPPHQLPHLSTTHWSNRMNHYPLMIHPIAPMSHAIVRMSHVIAPMNHIIAPMSHAFHLIPNSMEIWSPT